jgi:hypothetical protein
MKNVRLIALDRLPYGGKNFRKDEEFDATEEDAKVLIYIGKAARVKRAKAPARKAPAAAPKAGGAATVGAIGDDLADGGDPQAEETSDDAEGADKAADSVPASTTPRRRTNRNRSTQASQTK